MPKKSESRERLELEDRAAMTKGGVGEGENHMTKFSDEQIKAQAEDAAQAAGRRGWALDCRSRGVARRGKAGQGWAR